MRLLFTWECRRYGQQTLALKPLEKHLRVIKDDQWSRLIREWSSNWSWIQAIQEVKPMFFRVSDAVMDADLLDSYVYIKFCTYQ